MPTLLLRLAGPLQSWGAGSKFEIRLTENEPTKSGVIGMVAAALGRKRDEPVDDLAAMKFGVRADRPGVLLRDYHIAKAAKSSYVTYRYYLSDAVFLAGLESDDKELLSRIEYALRHPVFPLFLGRRSCVPTLPIVMGIRENSLLGALENEKPLVRGGDKLRIRYDNVSGYAVKQDLPLSFDIRHRKYGYRYEAEEWVLPPGGEHDPMAEL
ncbi:MAG TPA: type I-E CRISPR-associated protein Cas5/CasD [Candidatus Ornithomonoglobus intestinigallinarum]|uniref:Type I-E CRISPR-associated protein Cas5/CasD n=1 Tax=Candidatus Ornithomonoglobus intestinigallinarum TaxID=2840894 RepID=A0A9D1KQ73_9FIRM|nr:type I-E CRISPR-associated protein Cas5/CasD [Candidatus Ornithomonoglobus intestinigallinarum]